MAPKIRLPGYEDRTLIIGRTGSGKTVFGAWLLSEVHQETDRTIIIDYKREKQISMIPYAQYINVGVIPKQPGVYIVRPLITQTKEMEDYLTAIWDEENVRLFIDEGTNLSHSDALDIILTQGRSKNIPVIMLTQRPVGISRYAFSESQIFVVFPSHDRRERKTVSEFTPLFQTETGRQLKLSEIKLPRFHSYYYDVYDFDNDEGTPLAPVPSIPVIMETFEEKLRPPELAEPIAPQSLEVRAVPL